MQVRVRTQVHLIQSPVPSPSEVPALETQIYFLSCVRLCRLVGAGGTFPALPR